MSKHQSSGGGLNKVQRAEARNKHLHMSSGRALHSEAVKQADYNTFAPQQTYKVAGTTRVFVPLLEQHGQGFLRSFRVSDSTHFSHLVVDPRYLVSRDGGNSWVVDERAYDLGKCRDLVLTPDTPGYDAAVQNCRAAGFAL